MPRIYQPTSPTQNQRLPEYARGEEWIKDFLHANKVGHLAHQQEDQPFCTPTIYYFDEDKNCIFFHSNVLGRMHSNLQVHPKVCLEVSEYGRFLPANTAFEFSMQYRSVMVFGEIRMLEDKQEKTSALTQLLNKYFPTLTAGVEYRPITTQELQRTTVYELRIENWSGKENWSDQAVESPDWPALPDGIKNPR